MGRQSEGTVVFIVLSFLHGVLASAAVEVEPSINPAVVGDTVTLSLSPSTSIKSGSWAVGESQILTWLGEQQAVFPSHSGRASVNVLTGALTLSSVKVSDSGVYIVQGTDPQLKANTSITVLEAVSNVTLNATATSLTEFNSSAVITCSVSSGSALSFLWINGSSVVTAGDRVQLTNGNSTLTITSVTRYDQGPFKCHVFNPVSNETSDSVNFTITYGPDNMALTVNGQNTASFSVGSNLTMLCSVQSNPPAQLQWAFRGELVNTSGPLWELFSVSKEQSGPYSCVAFNNHTNMNSTITTNILISTPSYSQMISASKNPLQVGSTVILSNSASVTAGIWSFEGAFIVFIFPGTVIISNTWISRVAFDPINSSLTIKSLTLEDSGKYTLEAPNDFLAEFRLHVQVPVSGVTLKADNTRLVEFNDTAVLMCSVSNGSSLSYVWTKGISVVKAGGGVQFSDEDATLTITRVTRDDEGPFKCAVHNLLNHEVSLPVLLNVSYGPSNTKIMIMPTGYNHRTGSNVTLSCSAESSPSATIQWMLNGVYLDHFGPNLQLKMVKESDSGNYKCISHNTVTSRFSSASAMIKIVDSIMDVKVQTPMHPAIEGRVYVLTCNVSGPAQHVYWMKNGQPLHDDNRTTFSMDNKTVTFSPIQYHDTGKYQCVAFNPVRNMTSPPYMLYVNYGPKTPVVKGPSYAETGQEVNFDCYAKSVPPSHYSWWYNGSEVANTSVYKTSPLTLDMSGEYTCMAYNNITGKNSTSSQRLTVIEAIESVNITKNTFPIISKNFTLTCEVSGPYDSIYWMKDNMHLTMNTSTAKAKSYYLKDNMLHFTPVTRNHDGMYMCVTTNKAKSHRSDPYTLLVNYGPKMPTITGPKAAIPGDDVTLSCYASSNPSSSYMWFFNGTKVANTSEYVTPPFTSDMVGMYTCMAFNGITGKNSTAYTMIKVVDSIMDVKVQTPMHPAIEGRVYVLTCNVSGPAQHVYWMKNGQPLHDDNRTTFSMDNKTVTFSPIQYHDTGKYQCVAFNPVRNMTSPPYMLYVNYGPKTPVVKGPSYAETGQEVNFDCYAKSVPPSHYSWWYNGSEVANTSVYKTSPLTLDMSGEYTCMAYNNITGKNSTSSQRLTVIEAIESVNITKNTFPIISKNFTLTCEVSGPYDSIYWMKDNMHLTMNTSTAKAKSYYLKDNMLHFTPVTRNHDGMYMCVVTNKAKSHRSDPYTLLVNYGPLTVTILGLDSTQIGLTAIMKCFADSRPDSEFNWFYNDLSSPLMAGSVLSFPVTNDSDGTYICKARNPVTNITMYRTKEFTAHAVGLHTQSKAALMMGLLALSVNVLFN
ncbi:hemicentin-1-like [Labrus mixtus]|uniref:hemicentin-1-like n=1 Tax=Labrus mixtus TaxID=508554 RepID=UPI0029BFE026|nr:hemicentin-1-like [Labrus mixtus]